MKKTLVVLAAGIGSRFGGGIKQLEPVDDGGHIIIDYSIHDAIAYAFQELSDAPVTVEDRTKPWGTGHAVLACKNLIDSPFAVINADDYYGKNGFKVAAKFLGKGYALVGYHLYNSIHNKQGQISLHLLDSCLLYVV